jgi:hypothetical protein
MGLIGNRLGRGKTGRTRGRGGRLLCRSAKNRNPADLEPLLLANNYNYVQPGAKHTTMEGGISLGLQRKPACAFVLQRNASRGGLPRPRRKRSRCRLSQQPFYFCFRGKRT